LILISTETDCSKTLYFLKNDWTNLYTCPSWIR